MLRLVAVLLGLLAGAPQPEPIELNAPDFEIPINVRPDLKSTVMELWLFVSEDEGKSWQVADRVPPDRRAFTYHARHDGVYWFNVAVMGKDAVPGVSADDVTREPPALKVRVRTAAKGRTPPPVNMTPLDFGFMPPPRPVPPPPADATPFTQRLDQEIEALRHEVRVKQERLRAMEKLRRLLSEEPR
jgi:hypothetical protein